MGCVYAGFGARSQRWRGRIGLDTSGEVWKNKDGRGTAGEARTDTTMQVADVTGTAATG